MLFEGSSDTGICSSQLVSYAISKVAGTQWLLYCLPVSRHHQLTALPDLLQQELDPGYFNYAVVTGTLQRMTYVESDKKEDDKWLRFELKVPTPGSDTFTRYMSQACSRHTLCQFSTWSSAVFGVSWPVQRESDRTAVWEVVLVRRQCS